MSLNYLLDTCVISEFTKPKPNQKVLAWLNSVAPERTFLSAVTLGEIQLGISSLPTSNRRTQLEQWLSNDLLAQFEGRVLAMDGDTALTWGKLTAQLKQRGSPMSVMDSLIAATALHHNLALVTRNISDFELANLSLFNPWE